MALFNHTQNPYQSSNPRSNHRNQFSNARQYQQYKQPQFPPALERLNILCRDNSHPLPCAMILIARTVSDKGAPMAIYACPICNQREGWILDRFTGHPIRLWSGRPSK